MAPEDFNPDYLLPGTRIGAYVVRAMLGQGGSSSVYEVESAEGHRFALKMCRYRGGAPGTTQWRVDQRFSRSIIYLQLLKGLRNVAKLYAHDRHPDPLRGYQYLVQELVPDSLLITDWVKQESPPLRKLVGAFVELAELCSVMASKGICHRDLKTANILVTPDGTPKVIDFESAICPHAEPVTRREATSGVPGTGGWQCPEVCQAILEEESKKKSKEAFGFHPWGDLFSLGIVLHECLMGEHPFDISLLDQMLLAESALERGPIRPVRLSTAVPLGLNKVVMKLLERQPEARYRDGAEVANDLRKLLEEMKDERWDKPFKQPTPDEEEAPVRRDPTATEADTDVLLSGSNQSETTGPGGLAESAEGDLDIPRVLDFGDAGTYTLEECLGRGGYGEVYRARQVGAAGFEQWVAIKRLHPGYRPSEARSFVDEARVLSRLHHENIARVYAFHEWQGSYYMVMEYIEGHSLHALLEMARRKGHRFSEPVACTLMAEVADALHHAHHATDEAGRSLHIVHRDVSPTNILITRTGRVVLVDFGVAFSRREGREATGPGSTSFKGKVPYLSPEQVMHLPLDARSDQFAVGTILVEMLTGEAPFGWTSDSITLNCIATVTPEYVATLLSGVSGPLRALCHKLLARHPDQRFATEHEVAMALRRHAGLGEGQQSIQTEVERLQARPDAEAPPVAAARSPSAVRYAKRAVALASALMLAMLAFASWYVPRHTASVPSSSPRQGPAVPLQLPPEESIAPARPVLPSSGTLADKPKSDGDAALAAGSTRRREIVTTPPSDPAPAERTAPTVVLADEQTRNPMTVTAPPAERRTGGVLHVPLDSGKSRDQDQFAVLTANYVKVYGEALSPPHALAALFATGNSRLTQFAQLSGRRLRVNGVDTDISLWKDDDSSMVAVVVELTNPGDAPPWEPNEGRIVSNAHSSTVRPAAIRAMPRVILPGQRGRVALVFNQSVIEDRSMVEILRGSRPEFAIEISYQELEQRKSPWTF